MFKTRWEIIDGSEDLKEKFVKTNGLILLWILEKRSMDYMSENSGLSPYEIENNISMILYELLHQVGIKRFLKTLFIK